MAYFVCVSDCDQTVKSKNSSTSRWGSCCPFYLNFEWICLNFLFCVDEQTALLTSQQEILQFYFSSISVSFNLRCALHHKAVIFLHFPEDLLTSRLKRWDSKCLGLSYVFYWLLKCRTKPSRLSLCFTCRPSDAAGDVTCGSDEPVAVVPLGWWISLRESNVSFKMASLLKALTLWF